MTNEELDSARAEEAWNIYNREHSGDVSAIAARLAREGWTPPVPVDPDMAEAEKLANEYAECDDWPFLANWFLKAIKRGRALAAEAKPGLVWVKHDGGKSPIADRDTQVAVIYDDGTLIAGDAHERDWSIVVLYAVITPPEDVA